MNTLLKCELKANFKSLLIWVIITGLLIYVSYWEYGALDNPQDMGAIFTSFPQIAEVLFGVSPLGMNDIIGYAALIQYYIYFIGIAYAFILGGKLIQKELDDQTSEFLFTKPLARRKIYHVKSVVGVIYLALFNVACYGLTVWQMTAIGDLTYSNEEIQKYMLLSQIGLFLFMLVVYQLALTGNIIFKDKRYGAILAGLFIYYSYMTNIAVQGFEKLNDLTIISPWRYFGMDIIVAGDIHVIYVIILIVIYIIANALAYKFIQDKQF